MQRIKNIYYRLENRFGARKTKIGFVLLSIALIYIGSSLMSDRNATIEESQTVATTRTVSLYTISATGNGTAVRTADGNAYIVRSESGGRVERIAKVGDQVAQGTIVAYIENSAERAAFLQAEGAYEAAKAGATASDVGSASAERAYAEALTQAINTYRSAFADADDILHNTVDQVFSQPDTNIPGLKIGGKGETLDLNRDRIDLEKRFNAWKVAMGTLSESSDVESLLFEAEENTTHLSAIIVTLTSLLSEDDAVSSDTLLVELRADFASARSRVNGVLQSLSGARTALIQAESAKVQAEIAGTSGTVSLADAQVKQALGVLESARAALEKTSVKTPVAGTVTAVSISVGDIISIGSDVVFVAGDDTMAIKDTVTVPLTSVKFTPSKAYVFTVEEGRLVAHEVKTGSVTTNSITISGLEGVTSIVLDVRGLKEGDAVITQ